MIPQGHSLTATVDLQCTTCYTMAEGSIVDAHWQGSYQGKQSYIPQCESEILIIGQDESLQVADAVPKRICELTDDDKLQLERLNISTSSWYDDTSIMAARYALDEQSTVVHIERGTSQNKLSKSKVFIVD